MTQPSDVFDRKCIDLSIFLTLSVLSGSLILETCIKMLVKDMC